MLNQSTLFSNRSIFVVAVGVVALGKKVHHCIFNRENGNVLYYSGSSNFSGKARSSAKPVSAGSDSLLQFFLFCSTVFCQTL